VFDPKPPRRVHDLELLRELHVLWRGSCALEEYGDCEPHYSLHHILNKPRDDVRANLAMTCGSGTTGHHGRLTHNDVVTCQRFAAYLIRDRLDTMAYLGERLGGLLAVQEWLRSRLYHPI
jgi:hypothetical protein